MAEVSRWLALGGVLVVAAAASATAACAHRDVEPRASAALISRAPVIADAPPDAIRVLVGGDVLPHRPRLESPARLAAALAPMRDLFGEADATIVNYETATGDARDLPAASQHIALAASPAWMAELARAKVTAITGANNHACDLGAPGLRGTIAAAKKLGMPAIGVGEDDPWTARVVAEKDGHKVCAVAWTTFVNEPVAGCAATGEIAIAGWRPKEHAAIDRAIHAAHAAGCSSVIAILHGGDEYEPQAAGPLVQAQRAAFAGADAVVLHHPHVPSPVAVVATPDGRRVPVFESVGNLVSNQGESWRLPYLPVREDRHRVSLNAWTRLGVLADLRWTWPKGASERGELAWGYHLIWVDNDHAIHRDAKLPAIDARVFDPVRDLAIQKRLSVDKAGPLALFDDPCWMEARGGRCE